MNAKTEAIGFNAHDHTHHGDTEHGVKALRSGKDKLLLDLKAVVSDAQALLKEARDTSAEGIAGVPAYLEDKFSTVKDNFAEVRSSIESKAKQATAATDEYVRENPWKALGIVTAASVLLSILLVSACAGRGEK